jgi:hypothetical protein
MSILPALIIVSVCSIKGPPGLVSCWEQAVVRPGRRASAAERREARRAITHSNGPDSAFDTVWSPRRAAPRAATAVASREPAYAPPRPSSAMSTYQLVTC